MKPQLVPAHTYHRRLGGPDNAFRYSVDYLLSEPEAQPRLPMLLSRNRFNFASINDRDHGGTRGDGRGAVWVREVLDARGLDDLAAMRVLLLAQPRLLGYLFNPVSFWLVIDERDSLRAFIAEVNNTFGDRHSYLCLKPDCSPIQKSDTIKAEKAFHVSPFQRIAGEYRFNFDYTPDSVGVRIDFRDGDAGLLATLDGPRKPASSARLALSVIRRPFGSLRVMALIMMQAMILRTKRAKYIARPEPPEREVS